MKIRWLGHSCFLITSSRGTRVITDPYAVSMGLAYREIAEAADVVLISHDHGDHSNSAAVKGNPAVLKAAGNSEAKGLRFRGVATFHDETRGSKRGTNIVFVFDVDGVKVCHVGDLGHDLSQKDVADIGGVDVLLVPVGGLYTIDGTAATSVCTKLGPKVIIPMHYATSKVDTARFGAIAGVEDFLIGKANVERTNASEITLEADRLPRSTKVVVLKPAL